MGASKPIWIPPLGLDYIRRAANALDCAVQLCGGVPGLSEELDRMESRLDEIAASVVVNEGDAQ